MTDRFLDNFLFLFFLFILIISRCSFLTQSIIFFRRPFSSLDACSIFIFSWHYFFLAPNFYPVKRVNYLNARIHAFLFNFILFDSCNSTYFAHLMKSISRICSLLRKFRLTFWLFLSAYISFRLSWCMILFNKPLLSIN